jgi:hypothetical protein
MRSFLSHGDIVKVAERYPGVEMVVKRVENRHPHLRGVYGQLSRWGKKMVEEAS